MSQKELQLSLLKPIKSNYIYQKYTKPKYLQRRKDKVCPACGRARDTLEYSYCSRCRKVRKRNIVNCIKRKISHGFCAVCSKPVSKKNRRFCEKHRLKNLVYLRKRNNKKNGE